MCNNPLCKQYLYVNVFPGNRFFVGCKLTLVWKNTKQFKFSTWKMKFIIILLDQQCINFQKTSSLFDEQIPIFQKAFFKYKTDNFQEGIPSEKIFQQLKFMLFLIHVFSFSSKFDVYSFGVLFCEMCTSFSRHSIIVYCISCIIWGRGFRGDIK